MPSALINGFAIISDLDGNLDALEVSTKKVPFLMYRLSRTVRPWMYAPPGIVVSLFTLIEPSNAGSPKIAVDKGAGCTVVFVFGIWVSSSWNSSAT